MTEPRPEPRWLKPLTEYVPLALFFVAYRVGDLTLAIEVIVVVTVIAVVISLAVARRVPVLSLLGGSLVLAFGGASLALGDDSFYKMKPTVMFTGFAIALAVARAFGRLPLKSLLAESFEMTLEGWHKLTWQYAGFLLGMAAVNEFVWRTQSESAWVNYKVFGVIGLTLLFSASRMPFIRRHAPAKP